MAEVFIGCDATAGDCVWRAGRLCAPGLPGCWVAGAAGYSFIADCMPFRPLALVECALEALDFVASKVCLGRVFWHWPTPHTVKYPEIGGDQYPKPRGWCWMASRVQGRVLGRNGAGPDRHQCPVSGAPVSELLRWHGAADCRSVHRRSNGTVSGIVTDPVRCRQWDSRRLCAHLRRRFQRLGTSTALASIGLGRDRTMLTQHSGLPLARGMS